MFLFTGQGILTILVIALLLFGPDKLPQMGRIIGRFMAEFKRAQETVQATLQAEMFESGQSADTEAAPASPVYTAASVGADDEDEEEEE